MHGVKREAFENIPQEVLQQQGEEEAKRITHYKALTEKLASVTDNLQVLECTDELLLLNPDFMTAWNARRQALLTIIIDEEGMKKELLFGVASIKANPKSYGAWYHRKWLLKLIQSQNVSFDVGTELKLCNKLLDLDSRNFHCWNYRWFLTETFNVSLQSEYDFTTLMIYKNFSNYSAWHRRTLLLPRMEVKGIIDGNGVKLAIESDLKLIKSAYFTEPADQSAWFYLRWILDFATKRGSDNDNWYQRAFDDLEELLDIEPDEPLALSMWVHLARKLNHPNTNIRPVLEKLQLIDPLRSGMYKSLIHTP